MEKKLKKLFKKVIKKMKGDMNLYNIYPRTFSRDEKRFTVLGLCDLASNHLPDDLSHLFGISELEGHKIREYFHEYKPEVFICELYKEFPRVFEGESRECINWRKYKLPKDIPLFD